MGMSPPADPSDGRATRKFAPNQAACVSSLTGLLRRYMQEGQVTTRSVFNIVKLLWHQ